MTSPVKVDVSPEAKSPSHHISLDDGYTTVGLILAVDTVLNPEAVTSAPIDRTAMKTTTGSTTYGDFERPWTPAAQDDFSGGISNRNLEEDATRYLEGSSINTLHSKLILSGERKYATGIQDHQFESPGNLTWLKLTSAARTYTAKRIVGEASFTATELRVILRRIGSPEDIVISLHNDDAGIPGTEIASATFSTTTCPDYITYNVSIDLDDAITLSNVYWIQWYMETPDTDNYWMIGCNATRTYSLASSVGGDDPADWTAASAEPYYYLLEDDSTTYPIFFEHKSAHYVVVSPESGAPQVFIQGWRGVADVSADTDGLTDATQSWEVDELVGLTCHIFEGTGATQKINAKKIVSNTATKVVFDTATSVLDATTSYVISGDERWNEVTGHGLTGLVTDVLSHNGIVYFAQGATINMRRMSWVVATGHTWADDGSNKLEYLTVVREPTATHIWCSVNDPPRLYKASVVAWGTNLTFGSAITLADYKYGRITKIGEYGETEKKLWVMREALPFIIDEDDAIEEFPLRQIGVMADRRNGKAFLLSNIYLYFNWGSGIYRWYNKDLKDSGPTSDEGMPDETVGYCSCLLEYPGMIYASFAPYEATGYSTVYVHNGVGWCELYRSPTPGSIIGHMMFQTLGSGETYLWIYDGNMPVRVPTPLRTLITHRDPLYPYHYEGVFISSYYAANMYNIYKLYNSLVIFASNLSESAWIEADYQLDEDTEWIPIKEFFTEGPSQEVSLRSTDTRLADIFKGVTGKVFRYRLRIYSESTSVTPIIRSVVIEAISRIPIKNACTASIKIENHQRDLNSRDTQISAEDTIAQLRTWAANLTPLRMRAIYPEFDGLIVFLESPPLTPTTIDTDQYALQLVVTEI